MKRGGSSPDKKKSVRKKLSSSAKAHDKRIDALLAMGQEAGTAHPPADDDHVRSRHVRPDNKAEILVVDTSATAADVPGEHFVAYCRTHDSQSRRFPTEQQATRAAYRSQTWCPGCAPMAELGVKARDRAKRTA